MELGKIFCLISGLITLVATYVFAWFIVGTQVGHGIGVFMSLPNTFTNAESIAASWGAGVPGFAIYIVGGFLILFLFSGVLLLIGIKSRVVAIIGAIMPIAMALAIISGPFSVPPNVIDYISPFSSESFGIFPFNIIVGPIGYGASVSLGTYLLLLGGALGITGGILPRE